MARERLLLDTSVVVHLLRGKETGQRIDKAYNLRGRTDRPLISVVTVGEALGFAKQRRWGVERVELLRQLLTELVIVDINDRDILERYADLQAESRKSGWNLSDNDTWIAATASVTGSTLLTTDRDFERVTPAFLRAAIVAETAHPDGK
jgi:tRNA(fMet)-specific endonuclease VapC